MEARFVPLFTGESNIEIQCILFFQGCTTSSPTALPTTSTPSVSPTTAEPTGSPSAAPTYSPSGFYGVHNYLIEVAATGHHQISKVRWYERLDEGAFIRYAFPLVYLESPSGGIPNNWYGLHAGGGNTNGVQTCMTLCEALARPYE